LLRAGDGGGEVVIGVPHLDMRGLVAVDLDEERGVRCCAGIGARSVATSLPWCLRGVRAVRLFLRRAGSLCRIACTSRRAAPINRHRMSVGPTP
jgi:hypothetical protein